MDLSVSYRNVEAGKPSRHVLFSGLVILPMKSKIKYLVTHVKWGACSACSYLLSQAL